MASGAVESTSNHLLSKDTLDRIVNHSDSGRAHATSEAFKPGAVSGADAFFAGKAGDANKHLPGLDLLAPSAANRPALKIGDIKPGSTVPATVLVDGKERVVDIHVPKGYDGKRPMPVLYMLSGQAGAGQARGLMERESGMSEVADRRDFIVVYPVPETKAVGSTGPASVLPRVDSWNAPGASTTEYSAETGNDFNYMKALHSAIKDKFPVETKRVGIAGFSEGGEFAQAVAGAMPGTFSSVISDNGTRFGTEPVPPVGDKTSVLLINGDSNYAFPLEGGRGLLTYQLPKVADSAPLKQKDVWLQANGIDTSKCQDVKSPESKLDVQTCADGEGNSVNSIIVKGGKNAWDGGKGGQGFWKYSGLGNVQEDVDISRQTADFFLSHLKNADNINRLP